MKYINPKTPMETIVKLKLSEEVAELIKYYAEYSSFAENEIVDMFLRNLFYDPKFLEWAKKKRYNAKLMKLIEANNIKGGELDEIDEGCKTTEDDSRQH